MQRTDEQSSKKSHEKWCRVDDVVKWRFILKNRIWNRVLSQLS